MNCDECTHYKVCFMQKQIESLADKTTQGPFLGRTYKKGVSFHESIVVIGAKIAYKIREAIASNCPLYLQKDQGIDGESSSTGQSTGL